MIIVGLGNPGRKYAKTKHNVGFMFLDYLADYYRVKFTVDKKANCLKTIIKVNNNDILLIKPITYMNNSGVAVSAIIQKHAVSPEELIVVYDDMALNTAQVRIRKSGSSGGHNGIKSIIAQLQTDQFTRIRIGIGASMQDAAEYVLSPFSKQERTLIDNVIKLAPNIVNDLVNYGLEYIMNHYNG